MTLKSLQSTHLVYGDVFLIDHFVDWISLIFQIYFVTNLLKSTHTQTSKCLNIF